MLEAMTEKNLEIGQLQQELISLKSKKRKSEVQLNALKGRGVRPHLIDQTTRIVESLARQIAEAEEKLAGLQQPE